MSQIESGDPSAADQLLPLVYDELRKLAAVRLAQEQAGQTLQATALVHEAYLRLVGQGGPSPADGQPHWNSRGQLKRTLEGHSSYVKCIAWSPDGRHIASGGFDTTVRLWDVERGAPSIVIDAHSNTVYGLAFSSTGQVLASASFDRKIKLWSLEES